MFMNLVHLVLIQNYPIGIPLPSHHNRSMLINFLSLCVHRQGNRWITTGLMPQFLSIDLKLCWLIVEVTFMLIALLISQVRVIGHGIEEISISIEGSINKIPMTRENRSTFTFSSTSVKDNPNNINSMRLSPSKIFGDRVSIHFYGYH